MGPESIVFPKNVPIFENLKISIKYEQHGVRSLQDFLISRNSSDEKGDIWGLTPPALNNI